MADDLLGQFKGLMDNPDIGAQLKGIMPDGFDPAKLLEALKSSPDLLAKIRELIPGVDIEGALSGLAGAVTGAGAVVADRADDAVDVAKDAPDAAEDAAGGILGKVKDLFGR